MSELPISAIAEVNPIVRIPKELSGKDAVSFIPMGNVSESGQWTSRQERPLRSVSSGFTAFEEGDVLVAKITPCMENGKGTHATGLQNGIGFGSTEFHVLRAKQGSDPRFLFHMTQWRGLRRAAQGKMVGSAGQQRVPRSFFNEFLVAPFEPCEQAGIAQILDTLDTAIYETETIIAKLTAVKQGLLHDLLTRGIDANGELRPPQAEAPHLYKESPLGWIPKEWCASTVAEDFRVDSGLTLGPHRIPRSSGYPYLRVANVHRSRLDLDDVARLEASAAERATKALRVEDLLIVEGHASTEEIGRCALVTDEADGMLFQNHLFRLRANSLAPKFGLLWLNSLFVRSYWRSEAATSSGLNTINRKKLNRLGVAVPPDPEQEEIAACADAADSKLTVEMLTLTKLQQQKSALMDDLLTGRVRVTPLLEAAAP